jgi:glycosyltransferase involved in cell wall biosynthesis
LGAGVSAGSAASQGARAPQAGSRGRVCFFASHVWPAFETGRIEFAGGAEVQQAALARGLAQRGYEVTVATCDYGQGASIEREGIRFLATHPPTGGLPVLRFFHPRLTGNLRALLAAHAEVFYVRGAGFQAGLAYDVTRHLGAGLVFAAFHDSDADRRLPLVDTPRDRWWAARAIRGAEAVIAQTRAQAERFRTEWGREAVVIPNLVVLPPAAVDAGSRNDVLWLSTYKEAKRPDDVVELARRLPDVRFRMAGVIPPPPLSAAVFERVRAAAAGLPNLEVFGHLHRKDIAAFFASGGLFLHTSPSEGFPNTLLEAWAFGLPTVSRVDPDGIVARTGIGAVATDLDAMEQAIRSGMAESARRRETGARARAFVAREHAPERIVERVAAVIDDVVARVRPRRGVR